MYIFFVRHGESTENKYAMFDWMNSSLTELGIEQSKKVARRLRHVKIDKIFHSDQARAKMTAKEIGKFQNCELVESKLIREQKVAPSELQGLKEKDKKSLEILKLIIQNQHDPDWHYSDEENFVDLKKRVFEFLDSLNKLNLKNVLVIGHGHVLRCLAGYVLYGDKYDSHNFVSLKRDLKTANTGITICDINDNGKWSIVTWNDYAHLMLSKKK